MLLLMVIGTLRFEEGTYLTSWNRTLLEKLTFTQLVKIFSAFYKTRKFITVFTRTRRWTLSWQRSILLSSHLRL